MNEDFPQLYFIFSRIRSGTGALNSILQQHKDIVCLWEIFHATPDIYKNYGMDEIQQKTNYFNFLKDKNIDIFSYINDSCKNFCNYLQWINEKWPRKKIVIDVKYGSLHHFNGPYFQSMHVPVFLTYVKQHNFPIINLVRRNKLDAYVSVMLAEMSNIWHTKDSIKTKTIKINMDDFKVFLDDTIREDSFLENIFNSMNLVAKFEYNDLFLDGKLAEPVARKLEQVLDISGLNKFSSPFKKQVNSLENVIENFDEVSTFINKNYSKLLNKKECMSRIRNLFRPKLGLI